MYLVSPLVGELVTHATAGTLCLQYSTFCELGEVALRCGGAEVSQVCVLLIGHSAHKTVRACVEQSIQRLALPLAKSCLSMTHPEASLVQHSLNRAGTLTASGDHLLEEPFQPLCRV